MRQRPDTAELERLAEAILRDTPLPDDGQDRTYEQRMALKAQSIAAHDRENGAADMEEEIALFAALYDENGRADVEALNRRLATEIRAGIWDETPPALIALLMQQVRARLVRTNPRYLKATLAPGGYLISPASR